VIKNFLKQNCTHLRYVIHIYARLQNFIQFDLYIWQNYAVLNATTMLSRRNLNKLIFQKLNCMLHYVKTRCSLSNSKRSLHADDSKIMKFNGWSHLIWHKLIQLRDRDNRITFRYLALIWTYSGSVKFFLKCSASVKNFQILSTQTVDAWQVSNRKHTFFVFVIVRVFLLLMCSCSEIVCKCSVVWQQLLVWTGFRYLSVHHDDDVVNHWQPLNVVRYQQTGLPI